MAQQTLSKSLCGHQKVLYIEPPVREGSLLHKLCAFADTERPCWPLSLPLIPLCAAGPAMPPACQLCMGLYYIVCSPYHAALPPVYYTERQFPRAQQDLCSFCLSPDGTCTVSIVPCSVWFVVVVVAVEFHLVQLDPPFKEWSGCGLTTSVLTSTAGPALTLASQPCT